MYLAALLASRSESSQALKLGAGAGKSFICLLLAAYYSRKGDKVLLVVPNDLLVRQYQDDLSLYMSESSSVKCKTIETVQHEDSDETAVVICDEFD